MPASVDELITGITTYLNARGSAVGLPSALFDLRLERHGLAMRLTPRFAVRELTGEGQPEVILGFSLPWQHADDEYSSEGAVLIFACRDGRFQVAYRASVRLAAWNLELRDIVDMDQNGLPEVLYSYIPATGARGYGALHVVVIEWDGAQFSSRVSPQLATYPKGIFEGEANLPAENGAQAFWPGGVPFGEEVIVVDLDGDGAQELLLSNGFPAQYPNEGAMRARTDFYFWEDGLLQYSHSQHTPPEYRFQAVQDGDDATRSGFYDAALRSYQEAIFNPELKGWSQGQLWPDSWYRSDLVGPLPVPTPDPNERPRLEAYSRYRILLLHAVRGDLDAAGIVYDTLQAKFPEGSTGHPYAALASAFWQSLMGGGDLVAACDQAIAFAASHKQEILEPLGSSFYGYYGGFAWLEDLCPFREAPAGSSS